MNVTSPFGSDSTVLTSRLRPNPDVIAQQLGDEIVLLNLHTNRMYELNSTAARMWELLSDGYDIEQIHRQMLLEFSVDAAQLANEMKQLLASMQEANLVGAYE
jgi:hypothetical protein